MEREPLVSVVTPFYNTAPYLPECIESVLGQTYGNFEYLLVNNRSTDGSREIAAGYAARDDRIKLFDNEEFLEQLPNFNGALGRISPSSKYVKLALADDALFPECISRMVGLAEGNPSVGMVGAYYLYEGRVAGAGVHHRQSILLGTEALRLTLLDGRFLVGTPTTVLYRADIVRSRKPFYEPKLYHADTETAYEILCEHDFGFVHQVLSFVRTDNVSIYTSVRDFGPVPLDLFIVVERFGARVLSPEELERRKRDARERYYGFLGEEVLHFRERHFWEYHRRGLATIGLELRWRDILPWTLVEIRRIVFNPGRTLSRLLSRLRRDIA